MNKSSIIALLGTAILVIIFIVLGNQDIVYKTGDNLFNIVLISLRNYFILIGIIAYGFGVFSQMEAKKEKDLGVYSVVDGLINKIFAFIASICLVVGVIGITGYLV